MMENANKPDEGIKVRVTLTSRHDEESAEQQVFPGRVYRKLNAVYIRYEQGNDQEGSTSVTVRWDKRELRLMRAGATAGRQSFIAGMTTEGDYRTAFGSFRLTALTTSLREVEDVGTRFPRQLDWTYTLDVNGEPAGVFLLNLSLQEE